MSEFVDISLRDLNDCGCCQGLTAQTPRRVFNRPGLAEIVYRVGTHPQFKQSLLARLTSADLPVLSQLTTRDDDDFAIALLDGWATLLDVLTFYQERLANESYLRTATERLSIGHLARLIGYQLRPGVAAHTRLVFQLEDTPTAPVIVPIAAGTRVQSLPGPGEDPQTFETVEPIEAKKAWNQIRPRLSQPHSLSSDQSTLWLAGLNTKLQPGDGLLFFPDGSDQPEFQLIATVTPKPAHQATEVRLRQSDIQLVLPQTGDPIPLLPSLRAEIPLLVPNLPSSLRRFGTMAAFSDERLQQVALENHTSTADLMAQLAAMPSLPPQVMVFRQKAYLFGHNAPEWKTLPLTIRQAYYPASTDPPGTDEDWPNLTVIAAGAFALDGVYGQIVPDSWVVVHRPYELESQFQIFKVDAVSEIIQSNYTLNTNVTQIELEPTDISPPNLIDELRQVTVYAQSEVLPLARRPITDEVKESTIELDTLVPDLYRGQELIVCGESVDAPGQKVCERVVIDHYELALSHPDHILTLLLQSPLAQTYQRQTVAIHANLAPATHGETVQEVLGSGDASQTFQAFPLRQSPLTYVSAANAMGAASTLELRVNGVLWHEVPRLYGQGARDRSFSTCINDEGQTLLQFGDGRMGARLPTGSENITATYRKGIGLAGLVQPHQLTLLQDRPLGVKGVTNPLAATGAEDSESRDRARQNAPLTVLTLDRVVSLQDYEDFTRAYQGIDKALATWTWNGESRGVFITVAGAGGQPIPKDGPLYKNLLTALHDAGDPYLSVRVEPYRLAQFKLAGRIDVDGDYIPEVVLAQVKQTLTEHYSFAARQLGAGVALSQVMALIQAVPGVVGVDLDALYRSDRGRGLYSRLIAAAPQMGSRGEVLAAELLLLDLNSLNDLGVRS